jgi:hypothetical protein
MHHKLVKNFPNGESVIVYEINRDTRYVFISWGDGCNGTSPLFVNKKGEYFYFNLERVYLSDMYMLRGEGGYRYMK